jgi:hypothetical protein
LSSSEKVPLNMNDPIDVAKPLIVIFSVKVGFLNLCCKNIKDGQMNKEIV